jgi:cytidine deaminase
MNDSMSDSIGTVDWAVLRAAAIDAMRHAYVPYSKFAVGAAALVDDGRVVAGCNVENASYGLTLCAECAVVSGLHTTGGGRLLALACVDANGAALMPCGRCRQLLFEHGGGAMLIDHASGPMPLERLLPNAFGPQNLRDTLNEKELMQNDGSS